MFVYFLYGQLDGKKKKNHLVLVHTYTVGKQVSGRGQWSEIWNSKILIIVRDKTLQI